MNAFTEIIGQNRVKGALNFYLEGYNKTKVLSPVLLCGSKGYGKTLLARELGKNLKKQFIELNGASVRNLMTFVDSLVTPHIVDKDVTFFCDECHSMDSRVQDWLLSVLSPKDNISTARFGDSEYHFDYRRFTFIAATTNQEKLSKPFIDRFRKFDLQPYSVNEQIQILHQKTPSIEFKYNVEPDIISVCRGSPRTIVSHSRDIQDYCNIKEINEFGLTDWEKLKKMLAIRPLGLSNNEWQELKILKNHGMQTLTSVAAKLGLDSTTVRREVESFLLKNNLIGIDGKRFITSLGQKVLEQE